MRPFKVRPFFALKNYSQLSTSQRRILSVRLFSKKTSRSCHSLVVVVDVIHVGVSLAKTLTSSNISVIAEDIYLKLRLVVTVHVTIKGKPIPVGEIILIFFNIVIPLFDLEFCKSSCSRALASSCGAVVLNYR